MSMKHALETILVIGLGGLAFSGYLSYQEYFGSAPACSPIGQPGTMLGYPACIYGFFMYFAIVVVSLMGLLARQEKGVTREQSRGPLQVH